MWKNYRAVLIHPSVEYNVVVLQMGLKMAEEHHEVLPFISLKSHFVSDTS